MSSSFDSDQLANSNSSIETSMLRLLTDQDEQSWRQLSYLYGPLIRGWLRSARVHDADAADLEQEVLQSVWKNVARFRRNAADASFRGWLWTIVQNKVRDFHRRQLRIPQPQGGTDAQLRWGKIPAEDASSEAAPAPLQNELLGLVRRAVEMVRQEVKPHTWEAFRLMTLEGKSAQEVADELQLKLGSVYTAKSRVLSRLRELLGEQAEQLLAKL